MSEADAAKKKGKEVIEQGKNAAKDATKRAEEVLKEAQENPKQAAQSFLHTPFMKGALPFINGGLAGKVLSGGLSAPH